MVNRIGIFACLFGALICLYFLVEALIRGKEVNASLNVLIAGPLLLLFLWRLCILGRRALRKQSKSDWKNPGD